jgi:hypothetical protein
MKRSRDDEEVDEFWEEEVDAEAAPRCVWPWPRAP